jgi:hypothetical protein
MRGRVKREKKAALYFTIYGWLPGSWKFRSAHVSNLKSGSGRNLLNDLLLLFKYELLRHLTIFGQRGTAKSTPFGGIPAAQMKVQKKSCTAASFNFDPLVLSTLKVGSNQHHKALIGLLLNEAQPF